MTFPSLAPPVTDFSILWNAFTFNLGVISGSPIVSGLILLGIFSSIIIAKKGLKTAMIFALTGMPLIVLMGFFPDWWRLFVGTLMALLAVTMYVKASEGI